MNHEKLARYYKEHRDEFVGTAGHQKLVEGLKQFMNSMNGTLVGLDVGCCIGKYIPTVKAICSESNATILCFEPNPVNLEVLETKIPWDSQLKLLKHCVSNEAGMASFYNWKGKSTNVAGNGAAGLRSGGAKLCEVEVKRLDTVLQEQFPNEEIVIKFMKIDTEGNDTNVIKSLGRYLDKTHYIIFECSDCLDDIRGPGIPNPMKDIVDFLSSHGFDTYRIGSKKCIQVNDAFWNPVYEEQKFWSDCFAIRKGDPLIHSLINENFDYLY